MSIRSILIKLLIFYLFVSIFIPPKKILSEIKKKFLTTKYNEVNVRNGPGLNHLVIYKILIKGYPLEIISSFENWSKISDVNGIEGWISNSQLTTKKYVIITSNNEFLFKFPNIKSKKIAKVMKNLVLETKKCNASWCFVKEKEIEGWVRKKAIWGN
tara:strand:+ start:202 stop:672 length:471 start_codon:yes stop_codon:yes gene_type:complete